MEGLLREGVGATLGLDAGLPFGYRVVVRGEGSQDRLCEIGSGVNR